MNPSTPPESSPSTPRTALPPMSEAKSKPALTCRLPRVRKRIGRCYELAYRGQAVGTEWALVHGEVAGPPDIGRIGHAWLEFDGWVYCAVLDAAMPRAEFYRKYGATPHVTYGRHAAATLASQFRHYGPW